MLLLDDGPGHADTVVRIECAAVRPLTERPISAVRAILLIHQKRAWPVADHTELGMYDARAAVKCELLPSVILRIINGKLGDFAKETQE